MAWNNVVQGLGWLQDESYRLGGGSRLGALDNAMQNAYIPESPELTPESAAQGREQKHAQRLAMKLEIMDHVRTIVRAMIDRLDNFEAYVADGNPHIVKEGREVYLQYTGRRDAFIYGNYQWATNFLKDIQHFLRKYADKDIGDYNDVKAELRLAKATAGVN